MCECIKRINAQMKPSGHALHTSVSLTGAPSRAIIPILRTDTWSVEKRRGRPSFMQATFCPWCGEAYEPKPLDAEAAPTPFTPCAPGQECTDEGSANCRCARLARAEAVV